MQIVADGQGVVQAMSARWLGSIHDSTVLKQSGVYTYVENHSNNSYMLGDSDYGLETWLLTPYRVTHSPKQERYNMYLNAEHLAADGS